MRRALIIAAAIAAIIAATPVSAHIPANCHGLALERYAAEEAVIDALEAFSELANGRAPMTEADLALAAVYGRFIEYSDADAHFTECLRDAE